MTELDAAESTETRFPPHPIQISSALCTETTVLSNLSPCTPPPAFLSSPYEVAEPGNQTRLRFSLKTFPVAVNPAPSSPNRLQFEFFCAAEKGAVDDVRRLLSAGDVAINCRGIVRSKHPCSSIHSFQNSSSGQLVCATFLLPTWPS